MRFTHSPKTVDNPTGDPAVDTLRGVPDDNTLAQLRERNLERARNFARSMGNRYLLHPANRIARPAMQIGGN